MRGQNKEPGQFRKHQNWIGAPGCTIEQATFVPPNPLQLMDHLQAWEGVPKPTIHKFIKSLLNEAVLGAVREAAGRRPVILTFAELLNTLERKQLV